jgi:hypothetical protein
MFARTASLQARSGAGYVCLACRHERVLSARRKQGQRRWNSELHKARPTAESEADEWLLPLNDLSEDFGDKKTKPAKREAAAGGKREETSLNFLRQELSEHNQPDGDIQAGADGAGYVENRRARRLRLGTTQPSTRRARAKNTPVLSPKDVSALRNSLDQEIDGKTQILASKPTRKAEVPAKFVSSSPDMQALYASLAPLKAELADMAAQQDFDDSEAQYDEYKEKATAVPVPEPEVKSKEPIAFPNFSSPDPTNAPEPSAGFFSSTIKYFKEKVGLSRPPPPEKVEADSKHQGKEAGSATKQQVKRKDHSVESTFESFNLSPRVASPRVASQKSPIERWQESNDRVPWGANTSTSGPADEGVAKFDDIASADSISVKKPLLTSIGSRPFDSEPAFSEPQHNIQSLRGKLQESLSNPDLSSRRTGPKAALEGSATFTAKEAVADESNDAHSRLSALHGTPNDRNDIAAESSAAVEDTHDLAYLRKQHERERAERDVRVSIRKNFGHAPTLGQELTEAVTKEAERVLEGQSRPSQKPRSEAASGSVSDEGTSAPTNGSITGLSLGAAMRAKSSESNIVPKRRVGRPSKSRATSKNDNPDMKVTTSIPPSDLAVEHAASVQNEAEPATPIDAELRSSSPSELHITPLDIPQPPVPFLQYGLDRVLFNSGVYQLQDAASRVYNFDPYLQNIMPNTEFDFDSLKEYKTSSKDEALAAIARKHGNKYIGSTSSMTSALGQFHYLLSNWRPLNYGMLSHDFVGRGGRPLPEQLTQINRAPSAIFLRWKNGTYAIDADKEHDSANVLMLLGKSMELLLTLPKDEFERYRKSDPRQVTEEQRTSPESYQYTTMGDFLMRSQLDAYDPRLPGNGTFDLKTRAVVSVRHSADDHECMTGYEIYAQQGKWGSYEKEYYDMMRSTMLKYMLQARMGRMNGIFVAYHNVERMFGFQYVPIAEMDRALHGQTDPSLGDQEFRASLDIMNEVFNAATKKFPEQSLRIHFETKEEEKGSEGMPTALHVFAEPMSEEDCDKIQDSQKAKIAEWEKLVMGKNDSVAAATNADFANEVVQDNAADIPEDETAVSEEDEDSIAASQNDAADYARSQIQLDKQEVVVDAEATKALTDNSTSNADPKFLNNLAQSEELKPLFYATIIAQSTVNGQVQPRPHMLKQTDKWEIDYILKEYDINRLQWAMYEDVKARRKMAYTKEEEEEGVAKEESGYLKLLRSMSEKGRALRKAKDLREDGLPVVRVEDLDMERLEKVESVEDYMRFLEKPRETGSREMFG